MSEYASSYTGSQIDDLLSRAGLLDSAGKAPSAALADSATTLNSILPISLGGTGSDNANSARINLGIPFRFGIDNNNNNYGYYKNGADTFIPFKYLTTGTFTNTAYSPQSIITGFKPSMIIVETTHSSEKKIRYFWNSFEPSIVYSSMPNYPDADGMGWVGYGSFSTNDTGFTFTSGISNSENCTATYICI